MKRILTNYNSIIYLGILMTLVVMVSIFILSRESLRLDEAQSLWQISRSPSAILNTVATDVHLPLYHLLLYVWQKNFGGGVFSARMLSLIFFLASIPALYFLGKQIYDSRVGLLASTLLSLSPFALWYANEIRMYSLLMLITILHYYFFLEIYKKKENAGSFLWINYWAVGILGIYTHYFFFFVILSQFLFSILQIKSFSRTTIMRFVITGISWLISFLPWAYYVYSLRASLFSEPLIPAPSIINIFATFSQFLFGFQAESINVALLSLWPVLVLFAFFALQQNEEWMPKESALILAGLVVPVLFAFLISYIHRPLYLSRYLIIAMPPFFLILSRIFIQNGAFFWRSMKNILVVGMAFAFVLQTTSTKTSVRENYERAAQILTREASAKDIVAVSAPFTIYPIDYYYRGNARLITLPYWDRYQFGPIPPFDANKIKEEVTEIRNRYDKLWILFSYDQGYERDVRDYLDKNFERIYIEELSPKMTLAEYKLRYDDQDISNALAEIENSKLASQTK